MTISFRMTAVMANFLHFPVDISCSYFAFMSGLKRAATTAGKYTPVASNTISNAFVCRIQRMTALAKWQEDYNWRRPHSALGNQTPLEFLQAKTMDKMAA